MSKEFIAKIAPNNERYQEWIDVMGTNEIPITLPIPTQGSAPGIDEGLFYMIDLHEITSEQRRRMIKHIARKFAVDEEEVRRTLDDVGCPILDKDVTVVILNPQKWM